MTTFEPGSRIAILRKICQAQFGHIVTLDEWKALPFAIRREIDQQARQQANHSRGNR